MMQARLESMRAESYASFAPIKLAIARRMGAHIEPDEPVEVTGISYPSWRLVVASPEQAIVLFDAWARVDSNDPDIRAIATAYVHGVRNVPVPSRTRIVAERIHAFVRDQVRFQPEFTEVNRTPIMTVRLGAGDCDDESVLVAALCWAAGLRARVSGYRSPSGVLSHAVALIDVDGTWTYAETTVPAELGEDPLSAAKRLGMIGRHDIAG